MALQHAARPAWLSDIVEINSKSGLAGSSRNSAYAGSKFGRTEPFESMRLKAYRRGQQDVEYMVLLAAKNGWDREAVSRAVRASLDLSAEDKVAYEEDAGTVRFLKARDADFDGLRLRVARSLMGK